MKKCPSCGALQNDERNICIDCGKLLGASLSESEEKAENAVLEDTLENQAIHAEDMRVGAREIVLAVITAAAMAGVLWGFFCGAIREEDGVKLAVPALMFGVTSLLQLLFPRVLWNLERMKHFLWNAWEPASSGMMEEGMVLKLLFCFGTVLLTGAAWFSSR